MMREMTRAIGAVRNAYPHSASQVAGLILQEAALVSGRLAKAEGRIGADWEEASKQAFYPHLQAVSRMLMDANPSSRLAALSEILPSASDGWGAIGWLEAVPARRFAELLGDGTSSRFAFGWSAMPALYAASTAKQAGRALHVRFIDPNTDLCDLVRLAALAIDVEIDVVTGHPFQRSDGGVFDAELCMPPFNMEIRDRSSLPPETLDHVGVSETGRLHSEPVAMADALVHAPGARVVFSLSAGALFRTVGVEVATRHELIDSERLVAVYSVPSGMVYTTTGIATAVLVLESSSGRDKAIRMVDLADERFTRRTSRGRFEAREDASWAGVLAEPLDDDLTWARDVPVDEIRVQNGILTVERYLQTWATKALSTYLDNSDARKLGDVVELIRPRAVRKSDSGGYVIHEVSPSDVDDTGYLKAPSRETRLAHGALRSARNQQLLPGDVVLSTKGTIGRVGIVPDSAPSAEEDGFWTAGQSLMILRPRGIVRSEVLYEYLTNELVQEHVISLSGGAAIRSIGAKDLETLRVPVLPEDDQALVVKAFRARQERFAEIARVRRSIEDMRAVAWPHKELRDGTAEAKNLTTCSA